MTTTTQPPIPKRRWYQFSLKTLLVVVTVFTIGVGGIGSRMYRARQNRDRVAALEKAVAEVEELGGTIISEHEDRRSQTWLERQLDDPGPSNDPVRILHVKITNLVLSDITDSDLDNLDTLTSFATLDLNGKSVTQADLGHLKRAANRARMNRKRVVAVKKSAAEIEIERSGGRVEHGRKDLRAQTWLEMLFDDPGSEDDPVSELVVRRVVGVSSSKSLGAGLFTDASLEHVKRMTGLHRLSLDNTSITDFWVLQCLIESLLLAPPPAGLGRCLLLVGFQQLQLCPRFPFSDTSKSNQRCERFLPGARLAQLPVVDR